MKTNATTVAAVTTLLLLLVNIGHAEQYTKTVEQHGITVTATLSATSARVAEPVILEYRVLAPTGTSIIFPEIGKQLGVFDVVDSQRLFEIPTESGRSWTLRLTLESINTGDLEIPSLELNVISESSTNTTSINGTQTVSTPPIRLTIASLLEGRADLTQFRDIQSVVDVPVPAEPSSSSWIAWTVYGIGGVLTFAALMFLATQRRTVTPEQWALRQLEKLEHDVDADSSLLEEHVTRLSDIIRHFLSQQFELSSEQTAHELMQAIENKQLVSETAHKSFIEILLLTDQAKFAGLQLTESELHDSIQQARSAIQLSNERATKNSALIEQEVS